MVKFQNQAAALLIAGYLKQKGISNSLSFVDGKYLLTIDNQHDHENARHIVEHFIHNPNDPKYQASAWQQEAVVTLEKSKPTFTKAKLIQAVKTSPVVFSILFLCVSIYIATLAGGSAWVSQNLMIRRFPMLFQSSQWWRVISPAFIHFSELHIIFNLLWWWTLGRQLEGKFGSALLIGFVLVTAAFSNIAQLIVSGPSFGGLSGVVFAQLGFVWWLGWLKPSLGLQLDKPIVGFMLVCLIIGYADILWFSTANTAHTAGLVAGCGLAWLVSKYSKA